jgi:hypothetical protein
MNKEKYIKYKEKYLYLKKILKGGNKELLLKMVNEKTPQVTKIMNNFFSNNWVFSGSLAVLLLAENYNLLDQVADFLPLPSDFDIIIQQTKPISQDSFAGLRRHQSTIEKSMTFSNDILSVDLTFIDNKIKNITLKNGLRVVEPKELLAYYLEDLELRGDKMEADLKKIRALNLIIEKYVVELAAQVKPSQVKPPKKTKSIFDNDENDENDENDDDEKFAAKRLFF